MLNLEVIVANKISSYDNLTKTSSSAAVNVRLDSLLIKRSWNNISFRYLRTLFKAVKCFPIGFCMNWENLLTTKLMSGRVRPKYCKEPTIFLNSSISTEVEPFKSLERSCTFLRHKYVWCLCCERNNSLLWGITSTPKK